MKAIPLVCSGRLVVGLQSISTSRYNVFYRSLSSSIKFTKIGFSNDCLFSFTLIFDGFSVWKLRLRKSTLSLQPWAMRCHLLAAFALAVQKLLITRFFSCLFRRRYCLFDMKLHMVKTWKNVNKFKWSMSVVVFNYQSMS